MMDYYLLVVGKDTEGAYDVINIDTGNENLLKDSVWYSLVASKITIFKFGLDQQQLSVATRC